MSGIGPAKPPSWGSGAARAEGLAAAAYFLKRLRVRWASRRVRRFLLFATTFERASRTRALLLFARGPAMRTAAALASSTRAGSSRCAEMRFSDPAVGESIIWVIVGHNASWEGSYGWHNNPGVPDPERPPNTTAAGACYRDYSLAQICE